MWQRALIQGSQVSIGHCTVLLLSVSKHVYHTLNSAVDCAVIHTQNVNMI